MVLVLMLGFDPWNECSKGLADLLQEEKQTPKAGSTSLPHTHSFLPPFQSGVRFFVVVFLRGALFFLSVWKSVMFAKKKIFMST